MLAVPPLSWRFSCQRSQALIEGQVWPRDSTDVQERQKVMRVMLLIILKLAAGRGRYQVLDSRCGVVMFN